MSLPSTAPPARIEGYDDLLGLFRSSERPRAEWKVGVELERFGLRRSSGAAVAFDGAHGVAQFFQELVESFGWKAHSEYPRGPTVALSRGKSALTLEPGAQLEISSAPHRTVHAVADELRAVAAEIDAVCEPLDVEWITLGFHPTARQADLPWVPKLRYGVMRAYLPTRGKHGLDMMRRTATLQANLDYESEADAMAKLRVALRAQPIVAAMFANSPFAEGQRAPELSHRCQVLTDVDPARYGLLPFLWNEGASYRDYVEWALDVPMFLVARGSRVVRNTGQTFRDFWQHGFGGEEATAADWEAHVNSLFPDARLKRTIETRGTDAQSLELSPALAALWKGLLYDAQALKAATTLLDRVDHATIIAARPSMIRDALRATLADRPVAEWALELLEIAAGGLQRANQRNAAGDDESIYLAPMQRLAERGECPADHAEHRVF